MARQDRPARAPPAWFTRQFSDLLPPINDFVPRRGRDYGITRLTMWSEYVAAEVWSVVTIALLYGLVGLVLGATVVWWPLKSWLGELDRVSAMGDALVGAARRWSAGRLTPRRWSSNAPSPSSTKWLRPCRQSAPRRP